MVSVVNYIVLLVYSIQCISAEPKIHIDVDSKDCSPKELVITQGKCSRYVNDLMYLTEEYKTSDVTLGIAKNMSNACQSVTNCFGGIQCAEARKNQELYLRTCEKIEFNNYEMKECMTYFFMSLHKKKYDCSNGFDYLSKDMRIKRKAYTSGKSCFLEIAKTNCSEKSVSYLNSNYEEFLNILTLPSENGECNSLHDEVISLQCWPIMEEMKVEMMSLPLSMLSMFTGTQGKSNFSLICEELKECMTGSCTYKGAFKEKMEYFCDMEKQMKFEIIDFESCFINIATNYNQMTKYACTHDTNSNSTSSVPKVSPNFVKNKNCMKTVMTGECGEIAVRNFDKDWENIAKETPSITTKLPKQSI